MSISRKIMICMALFYGANAEAMKKGKADEKNVSKEVTVYVDIYASYLLGDKKQGSLVLNKNPDTPMKDLISEIQRGYGNMLAKPHYKLGQKLARIAVAPYPCCPSSSESPIIIDEYTENDPIKNWIEEGWPCTSSNFLCLNGYIDEGSDEWLCNLY